MYELAKNEKIIYHLNYMTLVFIISTLYGLFLTFYFPMDDTIIDRANYLDYAINSEQIILRYINENFYSVIFNEPLWLLINIFLSNFFQSEDVLRIIIFFISFTVAYIILKNNPKYFIVLLFFIFFTNFIKNYIIHIRQGLAVTIFLIGWFSISSTKKNICFILTPFIHSSFYFILLIYVVSIYLKEIKFDIYLKILVYITVGLFFSFTLGIIATYLGARQANEYEFISENISGLGFLFWTFILIIYVTSEEMFLEKNSFIIGIITFYLVTYFFIEISARVFESVVILVLFASLELNFWKKNLVVILIIVYSFFSYLIRMNQNLLGFGVL